MKRVVVDVVDLNDDDYLVDGYSPVEISYLLSGGGFEVVKKYPDLANVSNECSIHLMEILICFNLYRFTCSALNVAAKIFQTGNLIGCAKEIVVVASICSVSLGLN